MVEEKRYDGEAYPIKLLLEEAFVKHRNDIMDNFGQILQRIPTTMATPSTKIHFGGETHFKVQVTFDIPLFEG
jgi:hypothetical protein